MTFGSVIMQNSNYMRPSVSIKSVHVCVCGEEEIVSTIVRF